MNDLYDIEACKPGPAELEATKAEITAFREMNPTLTKTGLAVAFVNHRGGTATSAELHTLLELQADVYVSQALSSAVHNGRLAKDGKNWKLGPKKVAYQGAADDELDAQPPSVDPIKPETKPALEMPRFADVRAPEPAPTPKTPPAPSTAAAARPAASADAAPTPAKAGEPPRKSRFRFAVWSDGQVEIKTPGMPSIELCRAEFDELVAFVVGQH